MYITVRVNKKSSVLVAISAVLIPIFVLFVVVLSVLDDIVVDICNLSAFAVTANAFNPFTMDHIVVPILVGL